MLTQRNQSNGINQLNPNFSLYRPKQGKRLECPQIRNVEFVETETTERCIHLLKLNFRSQKKLTDAKRTLSNIQWSHTLEFDLWFRVKTHQSLTFSFRFAHIRVLHLVQGSDTLEYYARVFEMRFLGNKVTFGPI